MLKHFHLTKLQWKSVLKWTLYCLLYLFILVFEDVLLAKLPMFGAKLSPLPLYIVVVCIREGPETGGVFAILGSLFWYLSGVDYGNLSVAVLPICSILAAVLCRAVLTVRLLPTWICCFAIGLLNESLIFLFKLILPPFTAASNYWRILLPGVLLTLPLVPPMYFLVKAIGRIGVQHEL